MREKSYGQVSRGFHSESEHSKYVIILSWDIDQSKTDETG